MIESEVVRWTGYVVAVLCMVYVLVNAARSSWFVRKGRVTVTTPAARWEDAEYMVFTQHYDPGSAWNTPGVVPGMFTPEARWNTVDRWPRVIQLDGAVLATQAKPRGIFFNDPDVWMWCHNGFARYVVVSRKTADNVPPAQGARIIQFLCVRVESLLLPVEDVAAVPHG